MIKLIATDMDGTFLREDGALPDGTFEMIEKLHEKGILFVIATGRQTKTIENIFEPVKDKIAIIAENGGVIKHKGEELGVFGIPFETAKEIAQEMSCKEGSYAIICCKDKAYYNHDSDIFKKELAKYYHSKAYMETFEDIEKQETMKVALYHPEDVTTEIEPYSRQKWGESFKISVSGKNWVDIGGKETNKGLALRCLKEKLELKVEETMAFGDYFNDVEMLDEVAYSYAMEHAPDGVKAHAKYRAPKDGVVDIIYKEVLGK